MAGCLSLVVLVIVLFVNFLILFIVYSCKLNTFLVASKYYRQTQHTMDIDNIMELWLAGKKNLELIS